MKTIIIDYHNGSRQIIKAQNYSGNGKDIAHDITFNNYKNVTIINN